MLDSRLGNQVYGLALHIVRDNRLAEETAQDTFLNVWHKSEQWDPSKGQLGSWLLTIALRDQRRRRSYAGTCTSTKGSGWWGVGSMLQPLQPRFR